MRRAIILCVLALPFLLAMRKPQERPQLALQGESLFMANCKRCHGSDGSKGFLGAKNLQASRLSDDSIRTTVLNGRRIMPSFKKKLTADDIGQVMLYVKGLRH